jgi:hypothetical protein
MSTQPPTEPDPSPFDRIVDDDTPRQEALEWAADELTRGATFEDVNAQLVESGWSADDAAGIVEAARRATRGHRGAATRDDVVREANRHYRRSMGVGWVAGMPTVAALKRLLHALAAAISLGRRRGGG